jgi:hypothetical protein
MKWFNKLTRRPPPPPERPMQAVIPPVPPTPTPKKSIYVIPRIEGAIYNICLTNLLKSKTDPAWTFGTMVAAPWTKVVALPAFDLFRDEADRYYKACDAAGALVPTVTRYRGAIRIEFSIDDFLTVALFEPGETRLGYGERGKPMTFRVAKGVVA